MHKSPSVQLAAAQARLGASAFVSGRTIVVSPSTQVFDEAGEAARKRVVRLVLIMFWILVFEGSVRKWVAPQYSSYLYFLRDPFVLYVYFVSLRARLFGQPHPLLVAGLVIAALAVTLGFVHLGAGGGQYAPVLAIYGFRNYFLYLPLAFVIGRCFRYEDLCKVARSSTLAIMVAAPIAILQFQSSPESIINVGIGAAPELQFANLASGSGKVRPAGTFTSVMGMTQLTVSSIALLMWAWGTSRRPPPVNPWMVRLAFVATATAIAVSGSRTTFIHAGLVIAVGVAVAPFLAGMSTKMRAFLLPVMAVVAFVVLFPIVFPEAFHTFAERWTDAAATESQRFAYGWIGRAFYSFYDFGRLIGQIPILGYGIGTAGNGAVMMGVEFNGVSVLKLAEEDWSRHVIELGPVLALIFILYRSCFGIWLALEALRATFTSGDPLPVLLFAYVGVALVQGQLTGHGLVNGFGWIYIGLCMAACNVLGSRQFEPGGRAPESATSTEAIMIPYPNIMR